MNLIRRLAASDALILPLTVGGKRWSSRRMAAISESHSSQLEVTIKCPLFPYKHYRISYSQVFFNDTINWIWLAVRCSMWFVVKGPNKRKKSTMSSFLVDTKGMCNLLRPLFNEHLAPSSDSCCADTSSSSTSGLGLRFLQQPAMTLGLKNVGHLKRNLPDTSSPKIIVKSWSILNRKRLDVCVNKHPIVMVLGVWINSQAK